MDSGGGEGRGAASQLIEGASRCATFLARLASESASMDRRRLEGIKRTTDLVRGTDCRKAISSSCYKSASERMTRGRRRLPVHRVPFRGQRATTEMCPRAIGGEAFSHSGLEDASEEEMETG